MYHLSNLKGSHHDDIFEKYNNEKKSDNRKKS